MITTRSKHFSFVRELLYKERKKKAEQNRIECALFFLHKLLLAKCLLENNTMKTVFLYMLKKYSRIRGRGKDIGPGVAKKVDAF